ncbi:MAG: phosphodiester glycosidase family protein [Armatimonadota bacterium]
MRSLYALVGLAILTLASTIYAEDIWEVLVPGSPTPAVRHLHRTTSDPLDIHVVIVDLTNPRVRIRAGLKNDNDKPDDGETVRSLCQRYNAVVGINCDYFSVSADPWNDLRHIPQGHNMTDGLLMLPPGRTSPIVPDRSALAFPVDNSYAVVGIFMSPQTWWWNVVAGGPRIIRNGTVGWEVEPDIPDQTSRQPRTGAAVSADYRTLILATVDGRQASSRGMTANELGNLLKEFGGYNGLSFDGGGSTTMVINGVTVNSPSDGTDRRIANCLMILDRTRQDGTQVLFESDFEHPAYRSGQISGQDSWLGSGNVVNEGHGGAGNCLRLHGENAFRSVSAAPANGVKWFECWVLLSSSAGNATLMAGNADCSSVAGAIRFSNGRIQAYDTDQYGNPVWMDLGSYTPGVWYRVHMRLDYHIRRYQVFVDGRLKLSGASFKDISAFNGLQGIRFEESSGTTEFCVDDIYVGDTDPDFLRVSPDTKTMVRGSRSQFKAKGGAPPIVWQVIEEKNPDGSPALPGTIAETSPTGMVFARSVGSFVIQIQDSMGRIDRSREISIVEAQSLDTAKKSSDGTVVGLSGLTVSAVFDGFVYAQDSGAPSGIRILTPIPLVEGNMIWLRGTMGTVEGERVINASWLEVLP